MTVGQGQAIAPNQVPQMYYTRWANGDPNYAIPYNEQILSHITKSYNNTLIGLARLVDQANPEQAYWRFLKVSVPHTNIIVQPNIDLSQFKLLRVRDRTN